MFYSAADSPERLRGIGACRRADRVVRPYRVRRKIEGYSGERSQMRVYPGKVKTPLFTGVNRGVLWSQESSTASVSSCTPVFCAKRASRSAFVSFFFSSPEISSTIRP